MQIKIIWVNCLATSIWSRYLPPTKIKRNKIFLCSNKRREAWKIFENHDKIFENHDTVQKQRKYRLQSIIFSILWFKFNAQGVTLYFLAVISYQSLFSALFLFSKFFPRCMLQIIHHVWEFIIVQHHYVIVWIKITTFSKRRVSIIPWSFSS